MEEQELLQNCDSMDSLK